MKTSDFWQIRREDTGLYLQQGYTKRPGDGGWDYGWIWVEDQLGAGGWGRESVEKMVAHPENYHRDLEGIPVRAVLGPQCGCCGKFPRRWDASCYVIDLERFYRRGRAHWRCGKHVGRNPCCIEGCGSTFGLKLDEDYFWRFICGRHWREGPKWLRDRVAKFRKLAKRRGWTDQICRIHSKAWDRVVEAIIAQRQPADHIQVSAGPPPAGLAKELERLGL